MVYTLAEARQHLEEAHQARRRALSAQAYGIGSRSTTRAALDAIDRDIAKWERIVSSLDVTLPRKVRRVVVID